MNLVTYADLTDHCLDYLGGTTDAVNERRCRRAAQIAYSDLPNVRRWSYYMQEGRIATVANYSTGTVVYDHTGGASERMLTLTDGTWPSWAARGVVVINNVYYQVSTRESDSIITLNTSSNPGADVASTTYSIYRDVFTLPCDFSAMGDVVLVGNTTYLTPMHVNSWLDAQRAYSGGGRPTHYTITGDPDFQNSMAIRFFPYPNEALNVAFIYARRPRELKIHSESDGTVTTSSGSTTVTGSGTAFTSAMVGSVIRFSTSTNAERKPTGRGGAYPYHIERIITAYTSATSITVDADPGETLTGVVYTISDPADIEPGAMTTFLLRCVERQARTISRSKAADQYEEIRYMEAMHLAFEADSRHFSSRQAGDATYRPRLADMPITLT